MSETGKHIAHYSAADIQRYLKGELTAREMHEMEKAALEDPFLADALDGFEQMPEAATTSDLHELHTRLTARVNEKERTKTTPSLAPWLRLTAAAVLLLGLGWTAYYTLQHRAHPAESLAKAPASPTPPAATDTIIANAAPVTTKASPGSSRAVLPPPTTSAAQTASAGQTTSITRTYRRPAHLAAPAPSAALSDLEEKVPSANILQSRDTTIYANSERLPARILISGKVLDPHNNPLPGVTLQLEHLATSQKAPSLNATSLATTTVTDQDGYFSLKLQPQDSTRRLTIALVGYEQKSLAVNTLDLDRPSGNVIRLEPHQSSLDEVVIVGYGSKRKETRTVADGFNDERIDSLWIKALPVIGRKAYENYLSTAKKQLTVDSPVEGTVSLSFDIDKKGTLSSFKVEQSLSPAHDVEVIRLISEGPAWQILRGRRVRAEVRVTF